MFGSFLRLFEVCAHVIKLSIKMLSDEEIKKLWLDPAYPGSYSGVANFSMFLKLHQNEVSFYFDIL